MKIPILSAALCLASAFALAIPATADAASLRLRCEVRTSPARSKISVDGRNVLPNAMYAARVVSGINRATSRPKVADGDEVEFDFDSNTGEGGTRIPANFIRNNTVRAVILNASGQVVVGPVTASCRRD